MNKVLSPAHVAVIAVLLLAAPTVCSAFSGRVIYPDGKPVAGAEVNLFLPNPDAAPVRTTPPVAAPVTVACPANLLAAPRTRTVATSDSNGRFTFSKEVANDAMVQVRAPDGRDSATVTLPARMFGKGEAVIILPGK